MLKYRSWELCERYHDPVQKFYSVYLDKMTYPPGAWLIGMERIMDDLNTFHRFHVTPIDFVEHVLTNIRHQYDDCSTKHRDNLRVDVVNVHQLFFDLQEQYEMYWKKSESPILAKETF